MRKPIFAANWKMHHGPTDAREFVRAFLSHFPRRSDRTVVFFPPALTLAALVEARGDRHELLVGVQNIHWEDKGAFTGELSAPIARDAGARLVLVGHSERRHVFGETEEQAGQKVAAAVRAGLKPLLCVGEQLAERERGDEAAVVLRQLRAGLATIPVDAIADCLVAYEPVWAIGTGKTATPADAAAMHAVVGERASGMPILYGGSVNRGNAALLLAAEGVDGLLVGGASLSAPDWTSIALT
jgi:triosephosphate isomerase